MSKIYIPAYDRAARELRKSLDTVNKINVARLEAADRNEIDRIAREIQTLAAQLYSKAHAAFVAARMDEEI